MHLHRMPTSGGSVGSLRHGPVRHMVRETPFSWIGNRCRLSSWTQIPCVSDFGGPRLAVRLSLSTRCRPHAGGGAFAESLHRGGPAAGARRAWCIGFRVPGPGRSSKLGFCGTTVMVVPRAGRAGYNLS